MPSSLVADPLGYVHPADQTRRNVFYGDHADQRLNIYYNSTRVAGGNPVLVIVHGGSWASNDKTGFVEAGGSPAPTGLFWFAYFLDSATYGTTAYFDVVTVEYSAHSHNGVTSIYEPSFNTGSGTSLQISYPTYGRAVDDTQRALQYLAGLADRAPQCAQAVTSGWTGPRWDRSRFVLAGHSVGACTSIVAALKPSRPWNPHATGEYMARYPAYVRGVINWEGEVDLDTWEGVYFRHAKYLLGKEQLTQTLVRADVDREFLVPDASGAFPQGSNKTQRCKEFSPVDALDMYASMRPDLKIRSYYLKNLGPGMDIAETEPLNLIDHGTTYSPGYSAVPPYDAAGHDYRQFAILATKCAAVGIDHSGQILDGATIGAGDGVTGSVPGLDARQQAWEMTLQSTYLWAESLVQ